MTSCVVSFLIAWGCLLFGEVARPPRSQCCGSLRVAPGSSASSCSLRSCKAGCSRTWTCAGGARPQSAELVAARAAVDSGEQRHRRTATTSPAGCCGRYPLWSGTYQKTPLTHPVTPLRSRSSVGAPRVERAPDERRRLHARRRQASVFDLSDIPGRGELEALVHDQRHPYPAVTTMSRLNRSSSTRGATPPAGGSPPTSCWPRRPLRA